jgi:hypothetical protein
MARFRAAQNLYVRVSPFSQQSVSDFGGGLRGLAGERII